jgi:hypothetical protein
MLLRMKRPKTSKDKSSEENNKAEKARKATISSRTKNSAQMMNL